MSQNFFDMAEELQDCLRDIGRQVFLRQSTGQRCSCWDETRREADPECPTCTSFGWLYVDRKVLAYRRVSSETVSAAYRLTATPPGYINVDESVFYYDTLTQNVFPAASDWVIECITDADGNMVQPYKIQRIWEVNDPIDFRDPKGQIAFWELRCRRLALGK